MINNRNKHNQKYGSFRSYTDINNYNNFLLELDKKQKEEPQISINVTANNSTSSSKNEIKKIVKNINKDFTSSDYDNQNFTGVSPWESLLAAIENMILLVLTISVFRNKPLTTFRKAPFVIQGMIYFLIIGTIAFSQSLGNLGIMIRMRNMFLPGLIIFLFWHFSSQNNEEINNTSD
jgi:hypothetical protein